jgi:hypothetical protein
MPVFTRLPASESLLFAWPPRRRSGANGEASPKGGGQEQLPSVLPRATGLLITSEKQHRA